jgi:general secretion pathway protein G
MRTPARGFTLVELMVVMAIIATLLTIALPRYFGSIERAKESTLKQTLSVTRDAIDKFYSDHARYPNDLAELERQKYLRSVPYDPTTDSASTWVIVPPANAGPRTGHVYDLRSGSPAKASDGSLLATW